MKNSKLFTLNLNDFAKGLVVVVLTAAITALYQSYSTIPLKIDWGMILNTSVFAGLGYILKQIGTNSKGKILKKEKNAE